MNGHQKGAPPAEIHLTTVKDFYGENDRTFNQAVDAVVRGCVLQYFFDNATQKFTGTVTSLNGEGTYDVEIAVTDTFDISNVSCTCSQLENCYHIGALALNSGYETPIFSYDSTSDDGSDNDYSSECAPLPIEEVYLKDTSIKSKPRTTPIVNGHTENKKLYIIQKSRAIHTKANNYCSICEKMYENSKQLTIHQQKLHTIPSLPASLPAKTLTLKCPVCSIIKTNNRDMKLHMKLEHANHECPLCGSFFVSLASKEQHITVCIDTIDTGQLNYKCDTCFQKFTTFALYEEHSKTHIKLYGCYLCGEDFHTKRLLHIHRSFESCEGKIKHCCEICNAEFMRLFDLNRHFALAHSRMKLGDRLNVKKE